MCPGRCHPRESRGYRGRADVAVDDFGVQEARHPTRQQDRSSHHGYIQPVDTQAGIGIRDEAAGQDLGGVPLVPARQAIATPTLSSSAEIISQTQDADGRAKAADRESRPPVSAPTVSTVSTPATDQVKAGRCAARPGTCVVAMIRARVA